MIRTIHVRKLEEDLQAGRIDRRRFVGGLLAAGIAVPAALAMQDAVLAATPNRGGRLRQGFSAGSSTESLDALQSTGSVVELCNNWCWGNNLTEVQPDGSIAPELAESMEASERGRTWVFTLRRDVTFHNGKTLTPEDVIHSVNRHRGEDSPSAVKSLFEPIVEMTKDGDDKVVIRLDAPNADFPFVLSDYRLIIMASDADGAVDTTSGNGTGPYVVDTFEPGLRALFRRNPDYFKADRAHFDEVEHLVIIDAAARQSALSSGDLDVIDAVDPKTADLFAGMPGVVIQEVTGTQSRNMVMRLDTPPYDNVDLRLALKYSARRQEMIDRIEGGHGVVGNDHQISPAQQYCNTELPQREYDPDKAKFHLRKAGMEGIQLELLSSPAALEGATDAALMLKEAAEPVGIGIDVRRMPADAFWASVWNQPGVGFVTSYWGGRPTNDWMFTTCCVAESNWNDTAWKGTPAADRFNELIVAARSELDDDKRREMYWECQRLVNEDGGSLVWGFTNYLHGLRDNVRYPQTVAGNWTLDGAKSAERWWFA